MDNYEAAFKALAQLETHQRDKVILCVYLRADVNGILLMERFNIFANDFLVKESIGTVLGNDHISI